MGNYISCSFPTSGGGKPTTVVILADGRIIHISSQDRSHPAAEFMLDYPGNFLVNSCSLHVGRRFSALSADEELEVGHAYVMFPLGRVNSVVAAAADMGKLVVLAGKVARQERVARALMPVVPTEEPRCKLEEMDGDFVAEVRWRISACRSKKPMLETIEVEEINSVVCSRTNTLAGLFLMDLD